MAVAPCLRQPCGLESRGSSGQHDEYFTPLRSVSSSCESCSESLCSGYLREHCTARVYPCDDEDALLERSSATLGSSLPPLRCGTQPSDRRVFLCFKEPRSWPAVVEGADADRLLRFLAAAIKSRKSEMKKKTRLIVCEGRDGTDFSNGDVMIFPDMVRYRGLTHFDVDSFVDEVLVQNQDWLPGRPEKLLGTYVFVCAHGNREANFGVLGPEIIEKFKHEIAIRQLNHPLYVKPCSFLGGHKFAKNLIVYNSNGIEVSSRCYGCVTPDNVSDVLDDFCEQGYFLDSHGRQLDCRNGGQPKGFPQECGDGSFATQKSDPHNRERSGPQLYGHSEGKLDGAARLLGRKPIFETQSNLQEKQRLFRSSTWWQASWWFSFWEKEDTLATLAIIGAAASVLVAYHAYRHHGMD